MILPPMFSFNVLKLATMLIQPSLTPEEVTWQKIRKILLRRLDIFIRKCESIKIYEMNEEQICILESTFQNTYTNEGKDLLKKS